MGELILFVSDAVPILLLQFGIQNRDRAIVANHMALAVGSLVSESAERKGVPIQFGGIFQQGDYKIAASYIVGQIAEEKTAMRVIAHVLNNAAAVGIGMCLF